MPLLDPREFDLGKVLSALNFCFKGKVELHGKIMEVDYSVSKKLR